MARNELYDTIVLTKKGVISESDWRRT